MNWFSAILQGDLAMVKRLIAQGIDVDQVVDDSKGTTALLLCISINEQQIAEYLIEKGANLESSCQDGMTPLHMCAYFNYVDLLKKLIAHGADLDIQDQYGQTPLHVAMLRDYLDIAEILVLQRASLVKVDTEGRTAREMIIRRKCQRLRAAAWLVEQEDNYHLQYANGWSLLHFAVFHDFPEEVSRLIQLGADLNALSDNQSTPLHFALEKNNLLVAKKLIEAGANCNITNDQGDTAWSLVESSHKNKPLYNIMKHCSMELDSNLMYDFELESGTLRRRNISHASNTVENPLLIQSKQKSKKKRIISSPERFNCDCTRHIITCIIF